MAGTWNSEKFLKSDNPSFPYDQKYAILYHGASRETFYDRKNTREDARNPKSVLSQRYFSAGNGFGEEFPEEMRKALGFNASKPGFYMGFLKTALMYGKKIKAEYDKPGIVLKIKVPLNQLQTFFHNPNYKNRTPDENTWLYASSKQEMVGGDRFQNVEEFQQFCQKAMSVEIGNFEHLKKNSAKLRMIAFAVEREVPLGWIEGVWGLEKSEKPFFEPLDQYVGGLASRFPGRLPDGIVEGKYHSPNEKKEMVKAIETIEDPISDIETDLEAAIQKFEQGNRKQFMEACTEYYRNINLLQTHIEDLIDEEIKVEPTVEVETPEDLENLIGSGILEEVKGFVKHLETVKNLEVNEDEPRDFRNDTIKLIRECEEVMIDLPDLRPLMIEMKQQV